MNAFWKKWQTSVTVFFVCHIKGEDPWSPQPPVRTAASANDPWSPATGAGTADVDDFDLLTNRTQAASPLGRSNGTRSPFDMSAMDNALTPQNHHSSGGAKPKKSPESFLGPDSNLVNLENLAKSYHVIVRVFFVFRPPTSIFFSLSNLLSILHFIFPFFFKMN